MDNKFENGLIRPDGSKVETPPTPSQPTPSPLITPPSHNRSLFIKATIAILVLGGLGIGAFKGYTYFQSNPNKVWADTLVNISQNDSGSFKFSAMYSEVLTEEIAEEASEFLGSERKISLKMEGSGKYKLDSENFNADYDMMSTLSTKLGSINIGIDFLSRKIGNNLYYKLDGLPFGGLFGSESNGDEWVMVDTENGGFSKIFALQKNQLSDALKSASIMKPVKVLGTKEIDGKSTWHYEASLDKEELKKYIAKIYELLDEKESQDIAYMNAVVDKMEFKKLEVWIGKSDRQLYRALIESNAPGIFSASTGSAKMKARDARRMADIRQIMTALEIFYNDNNRYPVSIDGKPQPTDGNPPFNSLMATYPTVPTPPDGPCDNYYNKYYYQQKENGQNYKITFCVGHEGVGLGTAGVMEATAQGINEVGIPEGMKAKPVDISDLNFNGSIMLELNLSDFNKSVEIEIPEESFDAAAKSRDTRRLASVRQLMTAFELYYNDNDKYPAASGGLPVGIEEFIDDLPEAPEPADGQCTAENNTFKYSRLREQEYTLSFCLGGESGGYSAGPHTASPQGIK